MKKILKVGLIAILGLVAIGVFPLSPAKATFDDFSMFRSNTFFDDRFAAQDRFGTQVNVLVFDGGFSNNRAFDDPFGHSFFTSFDNRLNQPFFDDRFGNVFFADDNRFRFDARFDDNRFRFENRFNDDFFFADNRFFNDDNFFFDDRRFDRRNDNFFFADDRFFRNDDFFFDDRRFDRRNDVFFSGSFSPFGSINSPVFERAFFGGF